MHVVTDVGELHICEADMNHHHPVSESETLVRAAQHLIQNHGARAQSVAAKRANFLEQCGEIGAADTWHKIGAFVRAIEATGGHGAVTAAAPIENAPPPPAKVAGPKRRATLPEWPRPREVPAADAGAGVIANPFESGSAGQACTVERPH